VKIVLRLVTSATIPSEQRDSNEAKHDADQQTDLYPLDEKANGQSQHNRNYTRYISPCNVCLLILVHLCDLTLVI
jgi:hypothetical protein